eukprot:4623714-Pleurochrysis_carterae.AAC.2
MYNNDRIDILTSLMRHRSSKAFASSQQWSADVRKLHNSDFGTSKASIYSTQITVYSVDGKSTLVAQDNFARHEAASPTKLVPEQFPSCGTLGKVCSAQLAIQRPL